MLLEGRRKANPVGVAASACLGLEVGDSLDEGSSPDPTAPRRNPVPDRSSQGTCESKEPSSVSCRFPPGPSYQKLMKEAGKPNPLVIKFT